MRNFAKFAAELGPHLRNPQPAQVAVIASQAAQYSAIGDLQIEAQRKAVRTLAYYEQISPYIVYENQIEKMGSPKLVILPSAQALTETAWRALLKYVEGGGNLLITGPVERDEHWQRVNRAAKLMPDGAYAIPLTYHNLDYGNAHSIWVSGVSFDLQAQSWLESLRMRRRPVHEFDEFVGRWWETSPTELELSHGKGTIWWTSDPLELASADASADAIYRYVFNRINTPTMQIHSGLDLHGYSLSLGMMTYRTSLEDSILYVFVSDAAHEHQVEFQDKATGVTISFRLPAEHAVLVLIGKKEKAVIAKYGF